MYHFKEKIITSLLINTPYIKSYLVVNKPQTFLVKVFTLMMSYDGNSGTVITSLCRRDCPQLVLITVQVNALPPVKL